MDQHQKVPTPVNALIVTYGEYLGFEGFGFDAEGHLGLELDGIEIDLAWLEALHGLSIRAIISTPADVTDPKFLLGLHTANMEAALHGMGIVGFDADFGAWVWIDHLEPTGLTAAALHERLSRAAKNIAFWTKNLPALANGQHKPVASGFAHEFPMIRV